MSNPWLSIPPGPDPPDVVNVIVEVPRGSRNRYEMVATQDLSYYKLSKVFSVPVFHNGDLGIVPQTIFENGEPLECLIMTQEPTFPGCVVEVRPIGVLELMTGERRDDKVLAVPVNDPGLAHIKQVDDIPGDIATQISRYYVLQSSLAGASTEVLAWRDSATAKKVIAHSMRLFDKKVRPKMEIYSEG